MTRLFLHARTRHRDSSPTAPRIPRSLAGFVAGGVVLATAVLGAAPQATASPSGSRSGSPAVRSARSVGTVSSRAAATPPVSPRQDRWAPVRDSAGLQLTSWGYRFRSGSQANDLTVGLTPGGMLRIVDTGSTRWQMRNRTLGRTMPLLPDGCNSPRRAGEVVAYCPVRASGTVFLEVWSGGGGDAVAAGSLPHRFRVWDLAGGGGNRAVLGAGADLYRGGAGIDVVRGGDGRDDLSGGRGQDDLEGGVAADTVSGGAGADRLAGGSGTDTLNGGVGDDVLDGGDHADTLVGGVDNDVLRGGPGNDTVNGGTGRDRIDGGIGADQDGCNRPQDTIVDDKADRYMTAPVNGPLTTSGTALLNAGKPFVPYGIDVDGLSFIPQADGAVRDDEDQMLASAQVWCANTVRIQISQHQLLSGTGYEGLSVNQAFLDDIKEEVAFARHLGLAVVICLQTQSDETPDHGKFEQDETPIAMPTERSEFWWKTIIDALGGDQAVIFDLYNEPGGVSTNCVKHTDCSWFHWRDGWTGQLDEGQENGDPPVPPGATPGGAGHYLGLQDLAQYVRAQGAGNMLWVEGTTKGTSLAGVEGHRIADDNIVYSIHHPRGDHNAANWSANFGYLVEQGTAAVVNGEWAQYTNSRAHGACWEDARTAVPQYLRYLSSLGLGMIGFKLTAGHFVTGKGPTWPNRIEDSWHCSYRQGPLLDQGAGTLVMDWFHLMNGDT